MQLTVRDVATLLSVSEKTIYRWVKNGKVPAYRIGEQLRFNRLELLEWASARKIQVAQDVLLSEAALEAPLPSLVEALMNGGIFYRIGGKDRSSVLKAIVDCLKLPPETDRQSLHRILLAREELSSTAIGDGIAIPHVRTPVILHIDAPHLTLCFLERPIKFGALDGKPVHALFTTICPTVKSHLHLLSRLAFVLRDPGFKAAIRKQALRENLLGQLARAEERLLKSKSP